MGMIVEGRSAHSPDQHRGLTEQAAVGDLLDEKIGDVGAGDETGTPIFRFRQDVIALGRGAVLSQYCSPCVLFGYTRALNVDS